MITDGTATFALLNYQDDGIQWAGRAKFGNVGFTTHDSSHFTNHAFSNSVNVLRLSGQRVFYQLSQSNNPCVSISRCTSWYNDDINKFGKVPLWPSFLQPCPFTRFFAFSDFRFLGIRPDSQAVTCFQSVFPSPFLGAQTECCYNSFGSLVLGPSSSGFANLYHALLSSSLHQQFDIQPYIDCCVNSRLCNLYQERRPSTSSFRYLSLFLGIYIMTVCLSPSVLLLYTIHCI